MSSEARPPPAIRPWWSACLPSVAETWVCEISLRSIGRAPMRRFSARSWRRPGCCRCSRSARRCGRRCPPGSRLEVDRRQRDDLVVERDREALEEAAAVELRRPGRAERLALQPRSAIRFVTRANASRPLSVNSIVTSGAFVFGSNACSGFLMSLPFSSESSSSTKKRVIARGWFGAGSASTTTMPCGHLDHAASRPAGRPSRAPRAPSRHSVPLAYFVRRAAGAAS